MAHWEANLALPLMKKEGDVSIFFFSSPERKKALGNSVSIKYSDNTIIAYFKIL